MTFDYTILDNYFTSMQETRLDHHTFDNIIYDKAYNHALVKYLSTVNPQLNHYIRQLIQHYHENCQRGLLIDNTQVLQYRFDHVNNQLPNILQLNKTILNAFTLAKDIITQDEYREIEREYKDLCVLHQHTQTISHKLNALVMTYRQFNPAYCYPNHLSHSGEGVSVQSIMYQPIVPVETRVQFSLNWNGQRLGFDSAKREIILSAEHMTTLSKQPRYQMYNDLLKSFELALRHQVAVGYDVGEVTNPTWRDIIVLARPYLKLKEGVMINPDDKVAYTLIGYPTVTLFENHTGYYTPIIHVDLDMSATTSVTKDITTPEGNIEPFNWNIDHHFVDVQQTTPQARRELIDAIYTLVNQSINTLFNPTTVQE